MAKFEKSDYKKHQNIYSIMGKIGDILFYPIIIISLICCGVIFAAKDEHKVPTILGVSMVRVLTGSMVAAGFDPKDTVFTVKKSPDQLRVGDIIAFYYTNSGVSMQDLTSIQTYDMENHKAKPFDSATFNDKRAQKRTMKIPQINKISKTTDIYFHRIVGIYVANDGTIFYQTQGDSNKAQDGYLTAESLVVGKYIYTPKFFRATLQFMATSTGMIVTVVGPLCLLILFMLFSIIEQISRMGIERRVLRRELRYDDPESIKANIGIEMEISDKAKFYATAEEEERNAVANFLWGYMSVDPKQQLNYQGIMNSLKYIDGNANKYWLYFLGSTKSKRERKLIHQAWQEWITEEKIKEHNKKRKKKTSQKPSGKQGVKVQGKKAPQKPKHARKTPQKPKRVNEHEK